MLLNSCKTTNAISRHMLLFKAWQSWAEHDLCSLIKIIKCSTWGFGRFERVSMKYSLLQWSISTPTYNKRIICLNVNRQCKLFKHGCCSDLHILPHYPDISINLFIWLLYAHVLTTTWYQTLPSTCSYRKDSVHQIWSFISLR